MEGRKEEREEEWVEGRREGEEDRGRDRDGRERIRGWKDGQREEEEGGEVGKLKENMRAGGGRWGGGA